MFQYKNFFPFSTIRKGQKKAIEFILNSFLHKKKKYVILEAGTGVGKSAIGLTISRYLQHIQKQQPERQPEQQQDLGSTSNPPPQKGSYILTTQKILQQQYMDDYAPLKDEELTGECMSGGSGGGPVDIEDLCSISSATNYKCCMNPSVSCASSQRILKVADRRSEFFINCTRKCVYKTKKKKFIKSHDGVTNFAYFLAETMYVGEFKPRDLLIIDECHNISTEISGFIDIKIEKSFAEDQLDLFFPTENKGIYSWVKNEYEPELTKFKEEKEGNMEKHLTNTHKLSHDQAINLSKEIELLDKHVCKVRRFLKFYTRENWTIYVTEDQREIEIKPIDIAPFTDEVLFKYGANHVLMMSATILSKKKFCILNGLDPTEVDFIQIESPFLNENKPIMVLPTGPMSKLHLEKTMPKIIANIKKIMSKYPKYKGIIHCHTYKIAYMIRKSIKSNRLLLHNSKNRQETLDFHMKSLRPTVLLSPSMTEGIDLKDDLSRFQIICKIPYPYLGDPLTQKRNKKWPWWYEYETAKTLVQGIGRSVRSQKDYAITLILDSCWINFYHQCKHYFPTEFQKSIFTYKKLLQSKKRNFNLIS